MCADKATATTCGNHEMTEWHSMAKLSQQNNSFLLFLRHFLTQIPTYAICSQQYMSAYVQSCKKTVLAKYVSHLIADGE